MATLHPGLLRKLADWFTDGVPVTSLYLDVDGRRHPAREDYLRVLDDLLKGVEPGGDGRSRDHQRSVEADLHRIRSFVRDEFDRSGVRGLALFSSSGAGLWEEVVLAHPVRNRVEVGPRPLLIPLEALAETAETFCVVLAGREHARILLAGVDGIEQVAELHGDVPGWHDRGGWSQARFQRHIRDHVRHFLKEVAGKVLEVQRRRGFDHLVLAGTEGLAADLERDLHDYSRRRLVERISLPVDASPAEVLERCRQVEMRLEARRAAEAVDRLLHEAGRGTGRAVAGLPETLAALEAGRVEALVVAEGLAAEGVRCSSCGHLDTGGERCAVCGSETRRTPQLVEEVVESALRQRCRVETVAGPGALDPVRGIGGLLRY